MKIKIASDIDPNGTTAFVDVPDTVDLNGHWLDVAEALRPHIKEGWHLVAINVKEPFKPRMDANTRLTQ